MCGRYELISGQRVFTRFLVANPGDTHLQTIGGNPNDIRPTDRVLMLTSGRMLATARWGLVPAWAKDARGTSKLINARAEGIAEKPSFRKSLRYQRCIIPASAYFEWQSQPGMPGMTGVKSKVKYRIARPDGELFGFAGLYDTWRDPRLTRAPRNPQGAEEGTYPPLVTCSIITVSANPALAPLHPRMPSILLPEKEDLWLDQELTDPVEIVQLLRPYPENLLEATVA